MDALCKFCYENDITIVPIEKAREIAESRNVEYKTNYFPNPNFSQMLISYFGDSSSNEAYVPDGWAVDGSPVGATYSVSELDGNRVFSNLERNIGK